MAKISSKDNDQKPSHITNNISTDNPSNKTIPFGYSYRNLKAHLCLWLITMLGVAADLLSKSWAVERLGNPEKVDPQHIDIIEGYVRFIIVFNPGAVGGVGAGKTALLVGASVVAIIMLLWFFAVSRSNQLGCHIGLGMLLAGAMGNLYDRLFNNGKVIDFIDVNLHFWPFNPWPTFNIADVLLTVGVGILMIFMLRKTNA
ncbi:MAG: signal peptidase II [Sedimentisphaerales bacterium]|nr:signal peptidase II [Sedimentisphaerales bacterium]